MLAPAYSELHRQLGSFIPAARLVTEALRRLAWGTDASFYRLVPQIVVVVERRNRSPPRARMLRAMRDPGDLSWCGHQSFGPGRQRFGARAPGDGWPRWRSSPIRSTSSRI
jgi:D-lactate dehydrogenase